MLTRRNLLGAAGAFGLSASRPGTASAEAVLGDDGIYRQPWFLESFLELEEDLRDAADAGKRLAVMWELRGCPFCRDTHLVNLAVPEVSGYIRERFEILQLNLIGDREVTDFDGEVAGEKRIAQKYGVRFTPTILFFPEQPEGLGDRAPMAREVARVVGYQEPKAFRRTFEFVADRHYESTSLQEFLARA